MFLQVVSEHAWPRTATLAGPAPTRRTLAANKSLPIESPAVPAQFRLGEFLWHGLVPRASQLQSLSHHDFRWTIDAQRSFSGELFLCTQFIVHREGVPACFVCRLDDQKLSAESGAVGNTLLDIVTHFDGAGPVPAENHRGQEAESEQKSNCMVWFMNRVICENSSCRF